MNYEVRNYEVRKIEDIFWVRSPLPPLIRGVPIGGGIPLNKGASDSF
jgi:hypothetical protein